MCKSKKQIHIPYRMYGNSVKQCSSNSVLIIVQKMAVLHNNSLKLVMFFIKKTYNISNNTHPHHQYGIKYLNS